ncbi:glycerol channel [Diatrype stigma]|uniref:Glycerol channel n=1 Tax=Diatrype stigma TaxID=117547 RepID=A0AAN9UPH2_9PEZI
MVLMGDSVLAQTYLSEKDWSCAYIFGIYVAGDSGAYLNPAVTLTNCLFRGLPLKRFPTYAVSQVLGAFCAHGVTYANYISAFDHYEGLGVRTIPPNKTNSARIFCTFPAPFVPRISQFFSEFIANFVSMFCIFAMRDENGADLKGGGWFVLALFWLNFGLMSSFGWETGSPINPARDLTGRIWLTILGYDGAWSAFGYYSWIPLVVPFIATITGAIAYDMFVYTGQSPVNTPGLGILYILSKIRGVSDRPGPDEEKGEISQSLPDSDRTQVTRESGEHDERPAEATEEVVDKAETYDQPRTSRQEPLQGKIQSRESKLQQKQSKDYSYDSATSNRRNKHRDYGDPSGSS